MASLTANFFKSAGNLVSVIDEVLKIFDNFVFLSDWSLD
ncbi:hypothetical protein GXM_08435 [Nostoc sphaeroides CCNUC1]|uniref:Uncharacterized protein n=1 Tax=Nostoc sphaeroides CCNUC1 TaxID=2653204 RepID=A0A5P8WEE6_9NOSO|nr:hypothetical protein GXM_08435 [Nostoc sphaeroides CCNUC1]